MTSSKIKLDWIDALKAFAIIGCFCGKEEIV